MFLWLGSCPLLSSRESMQLWNKKVLKSNIICSQNIIVDMWEKLISLATSMRTEKEGGTPPLRKQGEREEWASSTKWAFMGGGGEERGRVNARINLPKSWHKRKGLGKQDLIRTEEGGGGGGFR